MDESKERAAKPDVAESDSLKRRLYMVIFEDNTFGGKAFDVALLVTILTSVIVVMLDTVKHIHQDHAQLLSGVEYLITFLFTVEYTLRIYCSPNRRRYATSFFGIIDILAILPTYINLFLTGAHYLMIVRVLRLLRLFRIFKLGRFIAEGEVLKTAIRASIPKIVVFLFTVLSAVLVVGALMYLIEGEAHGFTSIPKACYWAIVTLTTVGYGDIAPGTILGQVLACVVMIMGYGIIAVPTGIVSVEMHRAAKGAEPKGASATIDSHSLECPGCAASSHQPDARFCRLCGGRLNLRQPG